MPTTLQRQVARRPPPRRERRSLKITVSVPSTTLFVAIDTQNAINAHRENGWHRRCSRGASLWPPANPASCVGRNLGLSPLGSRLLEVRPWSVWAQSLRPYKVSFVAALLTVCTRFWEFPTQRRRSARIGSCRLSRLDHGAGCETRPGSEQSLLRCQPPGLSWVAL